MENLTNFQPSLTPQISQPKKWYQHKGILTILILIVVAGVSICVYFALKSAKTKAGSRDARRLADIRVITSAVELYRKGYGKYPDTLQSLPESILRDIPQAPSPADGSCAADQNEYRYSTPPGGQDFEITFCLGQTTGSYSAGIHKVSIKGISTGSAGTIADLTTAIHSRDAIRVADAQHLASALELYYSDKKTYPERLDELAPGYIFALPESPSPVDGSCTPQENTYLYRKIDSGNYELYFCLGENSAANNLNNGLHKVTPAGFDRDVVQNPH